jgi:hypothetical protein
MRRQAAIVPDHYIAFPASDAEKEHLLELARRNERDLAGEVRWRLRRVLRGRVLPAPAPEQVAS